VVSTTLVVKRVEEGHTYPVQHPVYFISEVLGPSKKKYPQVQKLLYVVLLTTRKLRHYFDDHKVIVVTVAEPPELFQLKCLSHASRAATHLNRNNPSVPQI
jgi:hypothetical protein